MRSCLATGEIMTGVVLAHTWAGGALPDLAWLIGLSGLVLAASWVVVTGRAPLGRMVLGLGAAQLGLHAALAALEPAHHLHHAHAGAPLDLTWQMVLAHATSAAITAAVWRVRRLLLDVAIGWPDPVRVHLSPRRVVVATAARVDARATFLIGAPRRGPPVGLRCA